MDLAIFCDILSTMGHHSRPFNLEHCGIDKNNLKWQENQLVLHSRVGSLIAMNNYKSIANFKPAALSLLEILHF